MRAGGVAILLVLGLAVACGGRARFLAPDASDDVGGSAGSSSRSGSAGTGGKTSLGSGPSAAGTLSFDVGGSASILGGTGSGGSSTCTCEPLQACAPGYYREVDPTVCCSEGPCVLDCRDVGCTDIDLDCNAGMHVDTLPGECCPGCVPDNPPSCEVAKELYAKFRAATLAKHWALGCAPQGCAMAGENNRCAVNCGTPVPAATLNAIEEELGLFAEATCSNCPPPIEPVCLPTPPLECSVNECTFAPTQ